MGRPRVGGAVSSMSGHHGSGPESSILMDFKAFLRRIMADLHLYDVNYDAVLNIVVTILVIAFIGYQGLSLMTRGNKKDLRTGGDVRRRKETEDKAIGDDVALDMHTHLQQPFVGEIPFHIPVLSEKETMRNTQYFYEMMKMRRTMRNFGMRFNGAMFPKRPNTWFSPAMTGRGSAYIDIFSIYRDRTVPMKVIQNIVKTAGTAPSIGNTQPWTFCVVVKDDVKRDIRSLLEYDERDNHTKRTGVGWVVDMDSSAWSRHYVTDAPAVIVVCHEIFYETEKERHRILRYNEASTSISVGILLAALQNAGLCSVVTWPMNTGNEISRLLKRPDNETVLIVIPIGYPADDAKVPDFKRKPLEAITRFY